jgi:hypothetical protein
VARWTPPVFSLLLALGCSGECRLLDGLEDRAGNGATNCGHVARGADSSSVDSCVIAAFERGAPFFASYERQGEDSRVGFGVASDAQRTVTFLSWDSDPSGGSNAGAVVSGELCVGPSVDSSASSNPMTFPLTCRSTTPLGRTCE